MRRFVSTSTPKELLILLVILRDFLTMQERRKDEASSARKDAENPNYMFVSLRFVIASFVGAIILSFITGWGCRSMIFNTLERSTISTTTLYNYDTSNFIHLNTTAVKDIGDAIRDHDERQNGLNSCPNESTEENEDIIPGRQLLVDIDNVNNIFLNSKKSLMDAMAKYIDERNSVGILVLPTCEAVQDGLFCYLVLKNGGRVTLNTWPLVGTISITILINDSDDNLISDVEVVKRFFGVPKNRNRFGVEIEEPYLRWAVRSRGFFDSMQNPEQVDLKYYITSSLERPWKKRLASVDTSYQSIEVFEMLHPRLGSIPTWNRIETNPNSYEAKNPHLFRPDRLIYLDGVLQSRLFGESAYHESLVHPAMLAHPNPRRVAIIGGGEGATMREVLKHNTIETVTMIEIDEEMVHFSREFIAEWSDCSFLYTNNGSCFDDPRAELFCTDAVSWFVNNYGEKRDKSATMQKYDVIIMDALDPDSKSSFSDVLYNNKKFVKALNNALTDDGILIVQTGMAADGHELPAMYHEETGYERIFEQHLKDEGFVRSYDYEDAHGGFLDIWTFMISFKSFKSARRWFVNQAQIDIELTKRTMPTKAGEAPFRYFDGATMESFQLPSRVSADFRCKMDIHPSYCEENIGFDPDFDHFHTSSTLGMNISVNPLGAFVGLDDAVNAMEIHLSTRNIIDKLSMINSKIQTVERFMSNLVAPVCIEGFTGVMDPSKPELAQQHKMKSSTGLFCENQFRIWNERDIRNRRAKLMQGDAIPLVA